MTYDLNLSPRLCGGLSLFALAGAMACGSPVSSDTSSGTNADTEPNVPNETDPDSDGSSATAGSSATEDPFDTDTDGLATDDGDSEEHTGGPSVCETASPSPEDGFTLDFGDWSLSTGIEGFAQWSGSCTITDVAEGEQIVTTIDCSAAPDDGPPLTIVTFDSSYLGAGWASGDAVEFAYTADDWNNGQHLTVRTPEGGLVFTLIKGGGEIGLPLSDEALAPFSATGDREACAEFEMDESWPVEVSFTEADGDDRLLLQGSRAIVEGSDGEQFLVVLNEAVAGYLTDHYGSYVDIVLWRLSAER